MDEFSVFLVDSDRLFREGLKRILEEGAYRAAGEARTVEEAAAALERAGRVDLLILDPADGAAATAGFLEGVRARGAKIVVLSSDRSGGAIGRAVGWAVDAYLLKDMSPDALTRSLQLVLLGQQIFPTRLMESLLLAEGAGPAAASLGGAGTALSRREVQILRHLMGGCSNKAIARELGISEATVKVHLKALLRKVRVSNRTQAAVWAMNNGIADQAT